MSTGLPEKTNIDVRCEPSAETAEGNPIEGDPIEGEPAEAPAVEAAGPPPPPVLEDETEAPVAVAEEKGSGENASAPPEDSEAPDAGFVELRQALETRLDALAGAFEDKLAYDAHKERQIEQLHRELQEHKRGLLAQATRPLLASLVRLHDDLGRAAADLAVRPREELTPERLSEVLAEFQDDVEIVLEENGVTVFREPVERFEPRRQTARQTVETPDAEAAGRIVRRVRPGFEQDGHLLMKERVEVFVLSTTEPATAAG